ncbi:Protein mono-ADP-ribosyltransferase PARP8 [Dirofilaria immitis]
MSSHQCIRMIDTPCSLTQYVNNRTLRVFEVTSDEKEGENRELKRDHERLIIHCEWHNHAALRWMMENVKKIEMT